MKLAVCIIVLCLLLLVYSLARAAKWADNNMPPVHGKEDTDNGKKKILFSAEADQKGCPEDRNNRK